jgi:two-component system, response regulator YcbB
MALSFCIIDDDPVCQRMLSRIVEDSRVGEVIGTADSGTKGLSLVMETKPDVVLIDLLMPEMDGIETIEQLKARGFTGKFIMISQIENKGMVGKAYQEGVEFFIHKPINRVEVETILLRVQEIMKLKQSLTAIKQSLASLDAIHSAFSEPPKKLSVHDAALFILSDMGIAGESGSADVIAMMEYLVKHKEVHPFPPLKELYEAAAKMQGNTSLDLKRESKAIEQRIRRTIISALNNLASLGLTDYANPKFEHYAPRFFDFQDVRAKMREIENEVETARNKVNMKKFLHVFYLETIERLRE